jgi:phosphoribosylformimino-5-aminoimidazole carboxamide ribotide isomerase
MTGAADRAGSTPDRAGGNSPRRFLPVPAVDLKGGRCVQLVGGRPEDERISLPDPLEVAARWRALGFPELHVVDLDAALGTGNNLDLIEQIVASHPGPIQVGGGVRDELRVAHLLERGVDRVVVGTRAVEDPAWLERTTALYPGRIVVAADLKDGKVLSRGWTEASERDILSFLEGLDPLPLAGVLCTDVGREGRLEGIDRPGVLAVLRGTRHPVWISGGVTEIDELHFLAREGARGAVLGMAIYTGVLDPTALREAFLEAAAS